MRSIRHQRWTRDNHLPAIVNQNDAQSSADAGGSAGSFTPITSFPPLLDFSKSTLGQFDAQYIALV